MAMSAILLCSQKSESATVLRSFLKANGYQDIVVAADVKTAQKQITQRSFAIILVDLPFTMDRHEVSFVLSLSEASSAYVMAIIKKAQYENLRDRVEKFGIFTLSKPIHQEVLTQLLSFIKASKYRYHQMIEKQDKLVDKIKEIKLVDRAKCLMIEHEYISEEEAHKRIEKEAMDERVTRGVIAQRMIREYQD